MNVGLRVLRVAAYLAAFVLIGMWADPEVDVGDAGLMSGILALLTFLGVSSVLIRRENDQRVQMLRFLRVGAGAMMIPLWGVFIWYPGGVSASWAMTGQLVLLLAMVTETVLIARRRRKNSVQASASDLRQREIDASQDRTRAAADEVDREATNAQRLHSEASEVEARIDAVLASTPGLTSLRPAKTSLAQTPTRTSIDRARDALASTERALARRTQVLTEISEVKRRIKSLSAALAEGRVSDNNFDVARREMEEDRYRLEEELSMMDRTLFSDEFEKPI